MSLISSPIAKSKFGELWIDDVYISNTNTIMWLTSNIENQCYKI